MDAFEDPVYNRWREVTLRVDLDLGDSDVATTDGRRDLIDALNRGLAAPDGLVLPLDVDPKENAWRTSRWPLGRSRLFVTLGTSPIGLRLPLDHLPAARERAGSAA